MEGYDQSIKQSKQYALAAAMRVLLTGLRLQAAFKSNPYWHLQPRVPPGEPGGGRWLPSGPIAPVSAVGPILDRLGPVARHVLRQTARRIRPLLNRLPRRWDDDFDLPREDDFDLETNRIGPPSWRRFGHPTIRFRDERELRRYLGPAGPGYEWHHIVEKRLAGQFPFDLIHNTDNIIRLPLEIHRRVAAAMSSGDPRHGGIVRRFWMQKLSYEEQYNLGIDLIERILEERGYDLRHFR